MPLLCGSLPPLDMRCAELERSPPISPNWEEEGMPPPPLPPPLWEVTWWLWWWSWLVVVVPGEILSREDLALIVGLGSPTGMMLPLPPPPPPPFEVCVLLEFVLAPAFPLLVLLLPLLLLFLFFFRPSFPPPSPFCSATLCEACWRHLARRFLNQTWNAKTFYIYYHIVEKLVCKAATLINHSQTLVISSSLSFAD